MVSLGPCPSPSPTCLCGHKAYEHMDGICMAEDCLCTTYVEAPEEPAGGPSNRAFLDLMRRADEIARSRIPK